MITPGAIVWCRQEVDVRWVVAARNPDGRWRLVANQVNPFGYVKRTSRAAGEGDLVEVEPAPSFAIGATIIHNGVELVVVSADGDFVELVVPATLFETRGGDALHVPAGNTTIVAKADLVLEHLE